MSPSEALLKELRAAKPAAGEGLRERVREIAAQEPAREPFLRRFGLRRFVLVAAPVTAVVAIATAGVIGLSQEGTPVPGRGEGSAPQAARESAPAQDSAGGGADAMEAAPPSGGAALPPTQGRLQRYDAQLTLRVDDVEELSAATQRAMRIARSLGGVVASVSYDSGTSEIGSAQLTLRVPIARVQQAVVQLSGLGTILGQRYGIEDLQPAADDLARQIEETQVRVAELQTQLRQTNLTDTERAVLRSRLAEARRQLADLRSALEGTRAEARLATIQLSLTTEAILESPPAEKGALDRVVDILRWEGLALLYALVVAGPFLVVGLAVWLALRARRRREEARLLAQP
ncbi:MAG TPA: DUF4349 domain-containing protein [Gaiellaceae bacterium]|nr:DUF4349 domain-containing protein [Gaiellaceae bacterium]